MVLKIGKKYKIITLKEAEKLSTKLYPNQPFYSSFYKHHGGEKCIVEQINNDHITVINEKGEGLDLHSKLILKNMDILHIPEEMYEI